MLAIQRKDKNQKGFTLAELLVVVAIIAVLVAVSIPIFTSKLEKSRETTDIANMRAAKAAATVELLDNEDYNGDAVVSGKNTEYYNTETGKMVGAAADATVGKGTAKNAGMKYGTYAAGTDYTSKVISVVINYTDDTVTVDWAAKE